MSYSRWSNSYWYTYWSCRDELVIAALSWNVYRLHYRDLKTAQKMETIVKNIKAKESASDKEAEELLGYMKEFVKDFEEEGPNALETHSP